MGCGSSTGASGVSMSKDPEDFHLDRIKFMKMKVPAFDTFLIEEVQPCVNKVVDIVNEINGCVDDIKDTATLICGGFKVDIDLEGARDHDKVVLSLVKADGTPALVEEVTKLVADAKVAKADAALAKARKALYIEMEKSYVQLSLASDLLAPPSASVDAFNKALGEFRTAIGAAYKVTLVHKAAGAGGAPSVRAVLTKPVFANPDSEDYSLEPLSVLDVAKSKEAKNIVAAELSVAEALSALSKAEKAAEATGMNVTYELKKKKLVAKMEGGEGDAIPEKKAAVRRAVSAANSQLFKLFKAARNANGPINIAKALVAVIESLKAKVKRLSNGAVKDAKDVITLSPKAKFVDEEFDFDLGLKVKLPDFQDLSTEDTIVKLLSGPAKMVYYSIMATKDKLVELFPEFKQLAEQVEELVKRAPEVFEEPADKIKEAFGEEDSDPFAIPKAVAQAVKNLKVVVTEPLVIVKTMTDSIVRLNDEMTAAVTEVKVMFP